MDSGIAIETRQSSMPKVNLTPPAQSKQRQSTATSQKRSDSIKVSKYQQNPLKSNEFECNQQQQWYNIDWMMNGINNHSNSIELKLN